jgi:hypothetical protein
MRARAIVTPECLLFVSLHCAGRVPAAYGAVTPQVLRFENIGSTVELYTCAQQ